MSTTSGAKHPNVLVIMTDELRAHNLGYAGDEQAHTPRLDRLAEESIDFVEAISGEPICCPARASFMTGQYPLQHGVYVNDVPLRPNGPVIGEVFRDHGYRTGYIGKWHLYGSPDGIYERRDAYIPPEERMGFDHWKVLECTHDYNHSAYYAGDERTKRYWDGYDAFGQTDDAIEFMHTVEEDSPFFLMLSYGPPHFPLQTAPDRYQELYADADVRLPPNVPEWAREQANIDLRGYYAHIAAIDECVGRLLDAVDLDNTVVVFTSDHGDMLWSQGLEHKLTGWEESVRVPLLIRAPRREPVKTSQLFNSPDLMPTLLGFASIPIPDSVTGLDLSCLNTSPTSAFLSAPVAYSSLRRSGIEEYRGVRDARYTFVRAISRPWLLYDNEEDPFQLHNRCDDPELAGVQARLERELEAWQVRLGDEFLPGDEYLRRDNLEHYFEVNEPLGFSDAEQWRSTNDLGRLFTIDTPISAIVANQAAHEVAAALARELLEIDVPLRDRRSLRLLAMTHPHLISDEQLKQLDISLRAIGSRQDKPWESVASPAWPPQTLLTPRRLG